MRGARALMIDLSTTCKPEQAELYSSTFLFQSDSLGTPETNLRGRSTRIALNVLRSTSPLSGVTRVINLEEKMVMWSDCTMLAYPVTTTTKSMMFQTFLR